MTANWPIIHSQEIRFVDLDAMGHVNNAQYLTYLEQARVAFFKDFWQGKVAKQMTEVFPFIIARIEIDFLAPIELTHSVTTAIRVGHIGGKSFHFEYEIRAGDTIAARAKSVQVAYDYAKRASMPLPKEFKEKLSALSKR